MSVWSEDTKSIQKTLICFTPYCFDLNPRRTEPKKRKGEPLAKLADSPQVLSGPGIRLVPFLYRPRLLELET